MRIVKLECANCGTHFERKYHSDLAKPGKRYCSPDCAAEGQRTISRELRICEFCGKPYTPKERAQRFCTMSCSARFNNPKRPKRAKTPRRGTPPRRRVDYTTLTIGQLRQELKTRNYHTRIRTHARLVYEQSGLPMECCVCGYTRGLDVCHLRPVSDFPDDTPISVVNALDNLIILDKLCHWEFDNGFLLLDLD